MLRVLPVPRVVVMVLVVLTSKPARWLTNKIIDPTDSINAHIVVVELLMNVLLVSCILTVVGSWIGMREVSVGYQLSTLHTFGHAISALRLRLRHSLHTQRLIFSCTITACVKMALWRYESNCASL